MNFAWREPGETLAGFLLAMKPGKHIVWSAPAAIAAALALSSSPLAAQSTDSPVADAPAAQPQPDQPAPPVAASPAPAPAVIVPDIAPLPAASSASATPDVQPSTAATTTTTRRTTSNAPVPKTTTTRTTVTHTTNVTHAAPAAPSTADGTAPAVNTGAVPALPADSIDAASPVTANPDAAVQPNRPVSDITGTVGLIALALLALIIALVGFLFVRRRSPVTIETIETPAVTHTLADTTASSVEPIAVSRAEVMATPTVLKQRDPAPVQGALRSDGASVDLPAQVPESYEERSALLDKMVDAKPDKANPFTDRRARLHRARLIMQSLGHTFDREPRIDLSQYPNNWPELARQYHKAA
jgi:hypothetical protein